MLSIRNCLIFVQTTEQGCIQSCIPFFTEIVKNSILSFMNSIQTQDEFKSRELNAAWSLKFDQLSTSEKLPIYNIFSANN